MEILVGAFAAWGFLMLLWTLIGIVLFPLKRDRHVALTVVIHGEGDAPKLGRYIKAVLWLRNIGLVWWDVVLLVDRLSPEARQHGAELLENVYYAEVISAEDLKDWMDV